MAELDACELAFIAALAGLDVVAVEGSPIAVEVQAVEVAVGSTPPSSSAPWWRSCKPSRWRRPGDGPRRGGRLRARSRARLHRRPRRLDVLLGAMVNLGRLDVVADGCRGLDVVASVNAVHTVPR